MLNPFLIFAILLFAWFNINVELARVAIRRAGGKPAPPIWKFTLPEIRFLRNIASTQRLARFTLVSFYLQIVLFTSVFLLSIVIIFTKG